METKINNKNIRITAIMLIVIFSVFSFFPQAVFASEISTGAVVKLVNESREAAGLSALVENSVLDAVAKDKIKDMLKNDYFAHTSPEGKTPWYWFGKNNYKYTAAGENLALNYDNAESQHKAWMASPTHKKNILSATYREIGVAVAEGKINGEETTLTVQVFGTPTVMAASPQKSAPAAPEPAVAPAAKPAEVLPAEAVAEPEVAEKNVAPVVPNDIKQKSVEVYLSDKLNNYNVMEIGWLSAIILFGLSVVVGPAAFIIKGHQLIAALIKSKYFPAKSKALVKVEEYNEAVDKFWHNMQKEAGKTVKIKVYGYG